MFCLKLLRSASIGYSVAVSPIGQLSASYAPQSQGTTWIRHALSSRGQVALCSCSLVPLESGPGLLALLVLPSPLPPLPRQLPSAVPCHAAKSPFCSSLCRVGLKPLNLLGSHGAHDPPQCLDTRPKSPAQPLRRP